MQADVIYYQNNTPKPCLLNMTYIFVYILQTIIVMYSSYSGNYGTGYGGYSSYGGYGGYGSMGSYRSLGANAGLNPTLGTGQALNPQDPNRPPQQEISQRRQVFEEYFKMMGGLRSMLEIGFSTVALCNFASQSWQLLKKIVLFLSKTSKKLLMKLSGSTVLIQKMGQVYQKSLLLSPNSRNGNTMVNKVLMALRVVAAIMLLVAVKLKTGLNKQVQSQHDLILKEYQEIKHQEEKLRKQQEQFHHEEHHQKQGYF